MIESNKLVKMGALSDPSGYCFYDDTLGRTFIVMNTYDVNNQPQYEEWTDANYRVHRVLTREQKIEGSFQVKFLRSSDYETFLSSFGDPSYRYNHVLLTVFVNNLGELREGYFYIEYTAKDEIPYMDGGKEENVEGFTINITEV